MYRYTILPLDIVLYWYTNYNTIIVNVVYNQTSSLVLHNLYQINNIFSSKKNTHGEAL